MANIQIEDYQDNPEARRELAEYLTEAIADPIPIEDWLRRFSHWWDANPFAGLHAARGWVVRCEGKLAGFLALIPVGYSVAGKLTPALAASTWVIDPACRHVSLPMFMKLRRLGAEVLIADTTPSPEVQALMDRVGWKSERWVTRRYFMAGSLVPGKWPAMGSGLRSVSDLSEARSIAAPCASEGRIEKWISLDALRWQLASPIHDHHFLGVTDESGTLSSFLILVRTSVKGVPAWKAVESWTCRDRSDELHALVGGWLRGRASAGLSRRPLLSVAEFESDESWTGAPAIHWRKQAVCHFFSTPKDLEGMPKHTVMAEGDLGL